MSDLRVLIAAENASTRFGGEAILPFHYFRLLRARGVDAHLITHARTRAELTQSFADDLDHLHFVEDQLLQKLFYRLGKLLPHRVAEATFGLANQLLTQASQRAVLKQLVTPGAVIHQPIPVSPRFPSLLYDLDAPVVIGPMNGGMEYPEAFRSADSPLSRWAIALGRRFSNVINDVFPGKLRANTLLVANERTRNSLPEGIGATILDLPENGVDMELWTASKEQDSSANFVFVGRLVDWKALDVALEALARTPEAGLDVIGDGPMRHVWQRLATDLGLQTRVRFHGWLSQPECGAYLAKSRALLLPSLYECGGAVVLETMACARPVIATAWGGPVDYLDATCGMLVVPTGREALVAGFASAMQTLIDSPELATAMGRSGREKVLRDYDWGRKIDRILAVYQSAMVVEHGDAASITGGTRP